MRLSSLPPRVARKKLAQIPFCPQGACSRVRLIAVGNPLDVRVLPPGLPDVALEADAALAEVVPKAGQPGERLQRNRCECQCHLANGAKMVIEEVGRLCVEDYGRVSPMLVHWCSLRHQPPRILVGDAARTARRSQD